MEANSTMDPYAYRKQTNSMLLSSPFSPAPARDSSSININTLALGGVDNLKNLKPEDDNGSNGYKATEESDVDDRGRLRSTWSHGEPARFLSGDVDIDVRIKRWVLDNPTTEYLASLGVLAFVHRLKSPFFGLPSSIYCDQEPTIYHSPAS